MSASLQLIATPGVSAGDYASAQLALARQLLQVLDDEYAALQAGDAVLLNTCATDKGRLLAGLDPHARTRLGAGAWQQFDPVLRQARERNLRNGEFIATQQAYVRARWAGLAAAAGHGSYYGADGITHLPPKPRSALGHA